MPSTHGGSERTTGWRLVLSGYKITVKKLIDFVERGHRRRRAFREQHSLYQNLVHNEFFGRVNNYFASVLGDRPFALPFF